MAKPYARQWIADRLTELGLRKKDLAHALGVDPSAVTVLLKGDRQLKGTEIDAVASLLDMTRGEVMHRLGYSAPISQYADIEDFQRIPVQGYVQAGVYRDADYRPDLPSVMVSRELGIKNLFGLRVRGESMNQLLRDGDTVICQPFYDYAGELEDDMLLVVERRLHDQIEATVKQLEIRQGQYWLWPRSDHPEFQTPIKVPSPDEWDGNEDHEYRVTAVVVESIRRHLPRR